MNEQPQEPPRGAGPSPDDAGRGPGLQIGRYELRSRLAQGGMGEVFLARAVGAGGFEKDVVIKRILPHLASDPGFVQRFIEEGKLVVRLRHAGIAQVLDMGEEQGVFFIAMEYVDGKDLGELLRIAGAAGRRMPVALVVHVLVALLDALDHAHHAKDAEGRPLGIIHRDVSPSNVMIATTGEVKLLDFGIARAAERLQGSTTGAIRGKYSYMSPQQAAGQELDPRSDLFSVGVLAWELLTGTRPFDGATDLATLDRIRYHDPGALAVAVPGIPGEVAAVVERLMKKAPGDRYANAEEAARALRSFMLKAAVLVTAKDLANWVEDTLATMPKGLRERPIAGLSLDEMLRLGLGDASGGPKTISAASTPGVGAFAGAVRTGLTPPPSLADEAEAAPARKRSKSGLAVWLVALNLALIGLVVVLVVKLGEDERRDGDAAVRGGLEVMEASVGRDDTVAPAVRDAGVAATAAKADVASAVVKGDAASGGEVSEVVAAGVARGGAAAGEALAVLGERLFAEGELTLKTSPPGGMITIAGLGTARAPRVLRVTRGTVIQGRATAPDCEARSFEAVVGDEDEVLITLKGLPRGRVQFRFFPADGTKVVVDGRPLVVSGNVVDVELGVGKHTLVLETVDGRRLVRGFAVEEGKTATLGTLEVGHGG
ncbi:MAG: serine/threonine protein kinase [Deltaproteobacteria bacterium]|nr:serine/threonine protein kinase [Deltaproteobacteria bacterium]